MIVPQMESLNRHFAALSKAAFERHGFASLELAAQWRVIVGDCAAAQAHPEKINWPRQAAAKAKLGGTLVLRSPAALALDIHYDIPRLIDRVNQYLGHAAISAIKVLKSAEAPALKPLRRIPSPSATKAWENQFESNISDPDLKSALARLGSAIKPQGPFSTGENTGFAPPPTSSRKLS
jgi:hypothetical protein